MMALYSDLPFMLIGDTRQHDPEVYAQIVGENPGRVTGIYIWNVLREAARPGEIARLTEAVSSTGSSLVLAADSIAMARHAFRLGIVSADAIAAVVEHRGHDPVPLFDRDPSPDAPRAGRRSTT